MRPDLSLLSLILAALLISSSAEIATAQPFSSTVRRDVTGVHAPRAIAAADMTRDGFQDLVLASTNPPAITILPNMGLEDGDNGEHFGVPYRSAGSGGPFDLAIGDLNRDGIPDVAVANADSDAITILLGTANGPLGTPIDLSFPGNPRGIAIGDFNRDSIPDIVATKFTGTTVEVLYGAGDGTFPRRLVLQAPGGSQGVASGDFDNDGWGDFAV